MRTVPSDPGELGRDAVDFFHQLARTASANAFRNAFADPELPPDRIATIVNTILDGVGADADRHPRELQSLADRLSNVGIRGDAPVIQRIRGLIPPQVAPPVQNAQRPMNAHYGPDPRGLAGVILDIPPRANNPQVIMDRMRAHLHRDVDVDIPLNPDVNANMLRILRRQV